MTTTINKVHNWDKLLEELQAWGTVAELTASGGTVVRFDETQHTAQQITEITAIINNHNASILTSKQQQETDSQLTQAQVKTYLRTQLINPAPNLATIKTTIQTAVSGNANIQQAITNIATLYGYDTGTDAGYVRSALLVISIMT